MSKANRNKRIRQEAAKQIEMRPDTFKDKRIHIATKNQIVREVEGEGEDQKIKFATKPVKLYKVISGKREAKRLAKLILDLKR